MARLAASYIPVAAVALGIAVLTFELWPRNEPQPITLTVTTHPPRTVTVVEPPTVVLVPLRVSTERDVPAPDLDGDGTPERLEAYPDSCGTGGCVYDVYLSSEPQRIAGVVEGKWGYWSVTHRRDAHADLTTTWFLGCCQVALTTYRYSRGTYRQIAHRTCDPREGRTPTCD